MPVTTIPEVTNHSVLIGALAVIRLEVESRQEDVTALATATADLHARVLRMAEELQTLNVDRITVGNVNAVADALAGQSGAAITYASLTNDSASQAEVAARTAIRNHGAIEEAVNDAPAPMADPAFYAE